MHPWHKKVSGKTTSNKMEGEHEMCFMLPVIG
jgi:hypothetical protein